MQASVFYFNSFIIILFCLLQPHWLWLVVLLLLFLCLSLKNTAQVLFVLAIFVIAVIRASALYLDSFNKTALSEFYEQKIVIKGKIVNDPQVKEGFGPYKQTVFYLQPHELAEKIRVSTNINSGLSYGDQVMVVGKMKQPEPFSNFNYPMYLKSLGIYGQVSNAEVYILQRNTVNTVFYHALSFKHFLFDRFQNNFPREQAGLMIALLTGEKNYLSKTTQQDFSDTGTAHIIAVSGFILTLIMLGFFGLREKIGAGASLLLITISAFLYLVMAGFAAGVVRAAVMSMLLIVCKLKNKEYLLLPALLFTATLLLFRNPWLILYDLGFIFSFLSILGIYLFNPYFNLLFAKLPNKFGIREIISSTFSAQLVTAPLTAYYFQSISIVAPFANLVILPLIPLILTIGYLAIVPVIGKAVVLLLYLPLEYILRSIHFLAQLPFAALTVKPSQQLIMLIYVLEIAALFWLNSWLKDRK